MGKNRTMTRLNTGKKGCFLRYFVNMKIDTTNKKTMHSFYVSKEWLAIRKLALERDHHECVWCKEAGGLTTHHLEVDHIKELQFYPELALDLDNLRTLCHDCHNKRHGRVTPNNRKWNDECFEW